CGSIESIYHVLLRCSIATEVWEGLGLLIDSLTTVSLFNLILAMTDVAVRGWLLTVAWSLWLHRKLYVWKGTVTWQLAVISPAEADCSNSVCWTRPEREWIKCNIDATMNKVQGASSFAVVIRDHTGAFIRAVSD
ncbi:hypothetical protein Goshw_004407, partial [Gossypium schwendimanii]|nr:hypothetical protein [Gossypium schwendimanii]